MRGKWFDAILGIWGKRATSRLYTLEYTHAVAIASSRLNCRRFQIVEVHRRMRVELRVRAVFLGSGH